MNLSIVVLAAGQGKRMRSSIPKVLHGVGGIPLLSHVLKTAQSLEYTQLLVVVGHHAETVIQTFPQTPIEWILQITQQGTGHAVLQALDKIPETHRVLVLYGDVPLITVQSLERLFSATAEHELGFLTATLKNASGFGRIVRNRAGHIERIIEDKDASPAQQNIQEINTGIILAPRSCLARWLPNLAPHNQQSEYYLTDIVEMAVAEGMMVRSANPISVEEILGVNDCAELAMLERFYQKKQVEILMQSGVRFLDPARFDLRGSLTASLDVVLDVNVVLEGNNVMGPGCVIGPHCYLKNVTLGKAVQVLSHTVIESAVIGDHSIIGPFARIRPDTELAQHVHVGNFVEIKKSMLGAFTKANHLTYLGDATIGQSVNIGAGTITCNYDGANKHPTYIGDHAFIGSGTQLVAPVEIGAHATIGAGTTLTENAPPGVLTLSRVKQKTVRHWKRPVKE